MRKIVLYCLTCILLSACIREDMDDCGVEARFIVTHNHSIEEFDTMIGNDVYFQIFQNEKLVKTDQLPYETIKGGREYVVTDYESGDYCIVAWAVPAGDPYVPEIPDVYIGESYHEVGLELSRLASNRQYYQPMGNIFLGEERVTLNHEVSSRHEVSLSTCICKVYFTLHRADLLMESGNSDLPVWVEVEGTRSEMMVDRSCGGEDAVIYKTLAYDSPDHTLYSDVMGVLPSEDDQYLTATVYKGGTRICTVETFEKAVPGDVIRIEATLGQDVVVYVNDWRVKEARITFY